MSKKKLTKPLDYMISLYQQALTIVNQSPDELTIETPAKLPTFRRHLCVLAAKKKKKFVTRQQGKQLFIKQYYVL